MSRLLMLFLLLALDSQAVMAQDAQGPVNVLLVVGDDIGLDNVGAYGINPEAARTPVLDDLADRGVLFSRAYANPVCSPSRATILTGRYGWRTGLGEAIVDGAGPGLAASLTTLPEVLAEAGYRTAAIGKWHLGPGDPLHPLQSGFEHHHGSLANFGDFYTYQKNADGQLVTSNVYATTDTVDDAIEHIQAAELLTEDPWFVYVAFNAAHAPFHKPPPELHNYALPEEVVGTEPIHTKAMIEAMDAELGRLLEVIDLEQTLVLFVGDNGPDALSVTPPWDPTHAKHTTYDLGVHVALIAAGPGVVQGGVCNALVNTTDLFDTVADVAGANTQAGLDSVSLRSYLGDPGAESFRKTVYFERFKPNFDPEQGWPEGGFSLRQQGARNGRFKLKHDFLPFSSQVDPGSRELFDLQADPFETQNLLDAPLSPAAAESFTILRSALVAQGPSPWTNLGGGLIGTPGVKPLLIGSGSLVPGTVTGLQLFDAHSEASGTLFLGPAKGGEPFHCGVLVPLPEVVHAFTTSAAGTYQVELPVPTLDPVSPLFIQAWIHDPGAECGFSASNSLVGISAP